MDTPSAMSRAEHPPRRKPHRLRRLLSRVFSRLRPSGPALLDHPGLLAAAQRLMQGERAPRRAAVLVFDFEDLAELRELYGDAARREALRQIARALRRIGGPEGIAARTGAAQFTVLIPGCSADQAVERAVVELDAPCRFELDLDGGEAVLLPDLLADECTRDGGGLAGLHRRIDERLAAHRDERHRREQYLRRSRERYSPSR